jgi:putative SOS response-associated peptidase YedK
MCAWKPLRSLFRDAWKKAQHCIIPAEAIYEPDWRSGKAIATRICRRLTTWVAGLWASWKSGTADGAQLHDADDQCGISPADAELSQAG